MENPARSPWRVSRVGGGSAKASSPQMRLGDGDTPGYALRVTHRTPERLPFLQAHLSSTRRVRD